MNRQHDNPAYLNEEQDSSHFSNPVCQQTYESLPKIYGTIKKRILNNKEKFYQNLQKRSRPHTFKINQKKAKKMTQISDVKSKNVQHLKNNDHQNTTKIQKQRQNGKIGAKFSDKFNKIQIKVSSRLKMRSKDSKDESETNHKVKFNTLHFLPIINPLHNGQIISSSNDNFNQLIKNNGSKSVMVNNPLVNLYKSRVSHQKSKNKLVSNLIEQENSQEGSSPSHTRKKHYTPSHIIKNIDRLKNNQNKKLRIQTDYSVNEEDYGSLKKSQSGQTQFSRRIKTVKSKTDHILESQESSKFHIPTKDEYKEYISSYKPINIGFSIKGLIQKQLFQIISYSNAVYFGQIFNKIRKGQAVMITQDAIFQGIFENDQKLRGYQQNFDGIYIGYFKNGLREGKGKFQWNNGQIFQGNWKAGKKNGLGVWTSPSGDSYEGQWLNGRQHGIGTHKHKNSTYKGEFINCLKHGSGEQLFTNGDRYKGFYEKGKPNGLGRYDWNDGSYYEGSFKDGYRQGKGVLNEKSGCIYKGSFKRDFKHGFGQQTLKSGEKFEGQFQNGSRVYKKIAKH